ncbi:hypothetical protein ACFL6Y_12095 [Elusimicrobiota bacterium]
MKNKMICMMLGMTIAFSSGNLFQTYAHAEEGEIEDCDAWGGKEVDDKLVEIGLPTRSDCKILLQAIFEYLVLALGDLEAADANIETTGFDDSFKPFPTELADWEHSLSTLETRMPAAVEEAPAPSEENALMRAALDCQAELRQDAASGSYPVRLLNNAMAACHINKQCTTLSKVMAQFCTSE